MKSLVGRIQKLEAMAAERQARSQEEDARTPITISFIGQNGEICDQLVMEMPAGPPTWRAGRSRRWRLAGGSQ
jgi:hypothetical protein